MTSNQKKTGFLPWIVWSCGGLFYFYQFILRSSPSYMADELMDSFKVQGLALGMLGAFYYYAYSLFQIPLGLILDRVGVRRVMMASCGICVMGCLVFASSSNLSIACLGRFLIGIGSAGAWIGTLKLATLWFPPDRVATVIGATMFLGTVGPFLCGPLVADMVDSIGWSSTVYVLSGIGLFLLSFIWYFVRDPKGSILQEGPEKPLETLPSLSFLKSLKPILKIKNLWINALYGMLMYVPLAVFADLWGVSFIQDVYRFDKPLAASIISSIFFGMCLGSLGISYFSDRVGSRRLPMQIGACITLIVYGILLYIPELPREVLYTLTFLSGFFFSGQLMCFAIAVESVPANSSGLALGFTNMTVMLSGVIFEPLVGWLLDKSHQAFTGPGTPYSPQDWKFALSSIIICLALALFLTFFIRETHPKAGILHPHVSS